jgi:hypothetical protein
MTQIAVHLVMDDPHTAARAKAAGTTPFEELTEHVAAMFA